MYLITWKNNLLFGEEKLEMEEALIGLAEALKKIAEEFFKELKRFFIKVIKQIGIDKIIKYRKYQKRVLNRKKLFAKRKAKYGR